MRDLIIVRGLPGSGKSTLGDLIEPDVPVISADDYFMINGEYNWKGEDLVKAHEYCLRHTEKRMIQCASKIVVTNTFAPKREILIYQELAKKYGYRFFSIIVENRSETKNVHDVPESTIKKMRDRFDIQL